MNAPRKEIEVDLKAVGCPYAAEDPRTLIWLAGYRKGMDAGAKVVSEVYDAAIAGAVR